MTIETVPTDQSTEQEASSARFEALDKDCKQLWENASVILEDLIEQLQTDPKLAAFRKELQGYADLYAAIDAYIWGNMVFLEDFAYEQRQNECIPQPLKARGVADNVRVFRAVNAQEINDPTKDISRVALGDAEDEYRVSVIIRSKAVNPFETSRDKQARFEKEPRLQLVVDNLTTGVSSRFRIDPDNNEAGDITYDICPNAEDDRYTSMPIDHPRLLKYRYHDNIIATYHFDSEIPYTHKAPDGSYLTFSDIMDHFAQQTEDYTLNVDQRLESLEQPGALN